MVLRVLPANGDGQYAICRYSIQPSCFAAAGSRERATIELYDPIAAREFDREQGGDHKFDRRAAAARAIHEAAPPRITWNRSYEYV
jgi:hypothetical protein